MWAIALKLCLLEQLSWQMTLLHMDKRGLQATPHVSFQWDGAGRCTTYLSRHRQWLEVDSDLLFMHNIDPRLRSYNVVQSISSLKTLKWATVIFKRSHIIVLCCMSGFRGAAVMHGDTLTLSIMLTHTHLICFQEIMVDFNSTAGSICFLFFSK